MRRTAPLFVVLVLAACGSSDGTVDTTAAPDTTAASVPGGASPTAPPDMKLAGPVTIDVTVGTDSGKDRIEEVALGSEVTVNITNPSDNDEFHLHGYDLSAGETKAGDTASITFTADKAGEFEVESHVTEDVVLVIVVK